MIVRDDDFQTMRTRATIEQAQVEADHTMMQAVIAAWDNLGRGEIDPSINYDLQQLGVDLQAAYDEAYNAMNTGVDGGPNSIYETALTAAAQTLANNKLSALLNFDMPTAEKVMRIGIAQAAETAGLDMAGAARDAANVDADALYDHIVQSANAWASEMSSLGITQGSIWAQYGADKATADAQQAISQAAADRDALKNGADSEVILAIEQLAQQRQLEVETANSLYQGMVDMANYMHGQEQQIVDAQFAGPFAAGHSRVPGAPWAPMIAALGLPELGIVELGPTDYRTMLGPQLVSGNPNGDGYYRSAVAKMSQISPTLTPELLQGSGEFIRAQIGNDAWLASRTNTQIFLGTAVGVTVAVVLSAYGVVAYGAAAVVQGAVIGAASGYAFGVGSHVAFQVAAQIDAGVSMSDIEIDWNAAQRAGINGAIVGAVTGAAFTGLQAIGKIQFNMMGQRVFVSQFLTPVARGATIYLGAKSVYQGVKQIQEGNIATGMLLVVGGFSAIASARNLKFCFTAGTQVVTSMGECSIALAAVRRTVSHPRILAF